MRALSKQLGHAFMTPPVVSTINQAVKDRVDTQVNNMHAAQQPPHLAHAVQERKVTVGAVPNNPDLLNVNGNSGCIPVDSTYRELAPGLLDAMNAEIERWGGALRYQWQDEDPSTTPPTIGLAQCSEVSLPVHAHKISPWPRRSFELPDEVSRAQLSVAPVNGTSSAHGTSSVNGTLASGVFHSAGDTSDWPTPNGQWTVQGSASEVSLSTGEIVPGECRASFSADPNSGTLSAGKLFCYMGLAPEDYRKGITVVSLDLGDLSEKEQAFALTKALMEAMGMKDVLGQADLTKLDCEVRTDETGQAMVASMFQPPREACQAHGFWPTPPQCSGEPSPLDKLAFVLGTAGNDSLADPLNTMGAPAPESLSVSEVQAVIRDMVAQANGDEMLGAFMGSLSATAVHHLLLQSAARLPNKAARWWINNLVVPIARSVVFAAVRHQFSGGADSLFRSAGLAIPVVGQILVVKGPSLGAFVRAAAHTLHLLSLAYAGWELYNGNVLPLKELLFVLLASAAANGVFAGLDALLSRVSPLASQQARDRLEQRLYFSPPSTIAKRGGGLLYDLLSEQVNDRCGLQLHATPAQALYATLPDFLKRLLDGVQGIDAGSALALHQLSTLRWLTSRLCPIGPMGTGAEDGVEMPVVAASDEQHVNLSEEAYDAASAPDEAKERVAKPQSIQGFVTQNPAMDLAVDHQPDSDSSSSSTPDAQEDRRPEESRRDSQTIV